MTEHALDAMMYAWRVMKEKEENKMEYTYVGKIKRSVVNEDNVNLLFIDHGQDISVLSGSIEYDNTPYCLVRANDILINNDKILKLRDEVKRLTDECNDWKARYAKANNELFQKGLAYGTLETEYKNEKIAGGILLKDRDALKEKVEKLEAELMEIKTTRNLREAYITGVEKGCESLREERDRWKNRWNSVVTDISKVLESNGITFVLKEIHGDGNWDVVIDIPELNEAKKKVEDLEKKLAASKSNESYWRDRKEEEEDYHHYWLHTFDRAVKQAAEKGIHIGVRGNDEECNAGVVIVDNGKAEELEKRVVALEKSNNNLDQKIGAADNALEYWNNTYNDIVIAGKNVGVKIDIKGKKPDSNAGFVYVTNEKALELEYNLNTARQIDDKWQSMLDALKDKGIEVIYMGEEDEKPIIDVKIPKLDALKRKADARAHQIDVLKKELETLKSRTFDNVEIRLSCGDIVWTYCDGFVHISSGISGIITADEIATGTIPKCSSCSHYMHNPSQFAHDWCYMPIPKEGGAGYIRKLNKEEAEGPACSDFKARKE